MSAALNVYRRVVNGQRPQANTAQANTVQQRQANTRVISGGQIQQPMQNRQAGMQQQPAQNNWYGQWQNHGQQPMPQANAPQGFVQQGGVYAPQQQVPQQQVQQPYVNPNEPLALRQARQAGRDQQVPQYAQPIQHFASRQDEALFDPSGQYNPQAYGGEAWRDGLQQAMPDPRQRMFDKSGQINAYDNKDALQQASHLLKNTTRQAKTALYHRQASKMMTDERRQILAAAVQDPEGFAIMGQELLLPIKDLVDYEGWARKVYRVRPLAQGELFRVAKDVRSTAWVIGQDGQGIEARLFGRYVTPSEFKIGSFPTVDIEEIYQMNYDVLDRAQDTARQEIELEEDKRGRALIDVASQTVNTVTSFSTLGVAAFEDVRLQIERHRLVVEKFLINRPELSDIVKTMSAQVDPVTERELILAGYIGSFLNAVIITSAGTGVQEVVPAGTFYACTGPEYMGEMGIRVELFSEPFNMFSQMRFVKGWAFGEIIGFVLPNPRAVAKGTKT